MVLMAAVPHLAVLVRAAMHIVQGIALNLASCGQRILAVVHNFECVFGSQARR